MKNEEKSNIFSSFGKKVKGFFPEEGEKNAKKTDEEKGRFAVSDNQKTLHRGLQFTAKEQYKLLRTNLTFTLPDGEGCKIIGVTSPSRGEGKSTTSVNLSYVLAESGKKTLLMDGDLRLPTVAKKMQMDSNPGITDFFGEKSDIDLEIFRSPKLPDWYVIPSGVLPPNPSELLGSKRMEAILKKFSEIFDYIVIDLPPVNIVSDALAISPYITGMTVVVRAGFTEKKELAACLRQLELSNVKILGCILNEAESGKGYYNKYRYKRYYYKRGNYYYKYGNYYKYGDYSNSGNSSSNNSNSDSSSKKE